MITFNQLDQRDQREIMGAVNSGKAYHIWGDDYRLVFRDSPDWSKISEGMEQVVDYGGTGYLYTKRAWEGAKVKAVFLIVHDELHVLILSNESYILCMDDPMQYILKDF